MKITKSNQTENWFPLIDFILFRGSEFRGPKWPAAKNWEKWTSVNKWTMNKKSTSQLNWDLIKGPPETLQYITAVLVPGGLRGALNWSPMMPRETHHGDKWIKKSPKFYPFGHSTICSRAECHDGRNSIEGGGGEEFLQSQCPMAGASSKLQAPSWNPLVHLSTLSVPPRNLCSMVPRGLSGVVSSYMTPLYSTEGREVL